MNGDFIFNPFWQSLGVILFGIVFVYCLYCSNKNLEDETEDEEYSTNAHYSARKY